MLLAVLFMAVPFAISRERLGLIIVNGEPRCQSFHDSG